MCATQKIIYRPLTSEDVACFRKLKLEGLKNHPEYFLSSYEDEKKFSNTKWISYLNDNNFIGCFEDTTLLGILCYTNPKADKIAHTTQLRSFYMDPQYRGRGFAKNLLNVALDLTSKRFEKIILDVNTKNTSAIKLYEAVGFKQYGLNEKALKIDTVYHDEIHMVKFL